MRLIFAGLFAFVSIYIFSYIIILHNVMAKTPFSILVDVNIDANGNLNFSGYPERIRQEHSLHRDRYVFSGIHVNEDSCPNEECYKRIWEVLNPDVFSDQPLNDIVDLPKEISYGQSFPKLKELIKAKPLKINTPYSLIIGVMGFNNNMKDKIYFSAHAYFMLIKDKKGVILIKQRDGVRSNW